MFNVYFVSSACRVQCVLASCLITLKSLPEKLNPVIRPLMDAIKREENLQLQVWPWPWWPTSLTRSLCTFVQPCGVFSCRSLPRRVYRMSSSCVLVERRIRATKSSRIFAISWVVTKRSHHKSVTSPPARSNHNKKELWHWRKTQEDSYEKESLQNEADLKRRRATTKLSWRRSGLTSS